MPYYQTYNYYRPTFFGGFKFFPLVIRILLIVNASIFLLTSFLGFFRLGGVPVSYFIESVFALYPIFSETPHMPHFYVWQLVTYLFLHANFLHLFFNMLALWIFGMELENNWGSARFLIYYFVCGIAAGISNLFLGPLFGQGGPTVGASGSVYGILLAYGMIFPNRQIYLYFLLPVRAKYFVMAFIAIELFAGITGTQDGVAHFAHLGGAGAGFILLIYNKYRKQLIMHINDILKIYDKPHRFTPRKSDTIKDARYFDIDSTDQTELQKRIDEILDKINKEGYQSLTNEEKDILREASKKL